VPNEDGPPPLTAQFGGFVANSSSLVAVAANGLGQYAVVGQSVTNVQYLAIYDSVTHNQICETAFLATQDGADPYDRGSALGVSPSGNGDGTWYVAGTQHDQVSLPDDFDATIVHFNGSCADIDPVGTTAPHNDAIVGDVGHDEFRGISSTATAGVVAAGEVEISGHNYSAGRFANDLQTASYLFYYPVTGAAGPNDWFALACDPAANCAAGGWIKIDGMPGQRLTLNQLAPDGSVPGSIFFFSDSGDSRFNSLSRTGSVATGNLLWYAGGSIVDTGLMAPCNAPPRTCAIVFSALSQDFSADNCAVYFTDSTAGEGTTIDGAGHIYTVNGLDPLTSPPGPLATVELNVTDCSAVPPGVAFGGTGSLNVCGGNAWDTAAGTTSPELAACTTSSPDWAPVTDGTSLTGAQNGVVAGFGP
jgi:hypothetical protein